MNEFRSLKFLDLFEVVFRRFNIDYDVMRKILQMKLTMDQRRAPTVFNDAKQREGNQFLKSLGIYALYGLILIPFLFLGENYILQMSIIFGITMFILMTSMISDFSSVLLDVRDKNILNTKPVNARTVSAAKLIHVSIYMALLTGAFIGVPSLVILGVHGILFFLLFLVALLLLVVFIIALTALVYIFILRFFGGEQLKDMINYVQILLSVGIIVGYQVLIRSFDLVNLDVSYIFSWWHVLIPPIWFGASFELLLHQDLSNGVVLLTLLAVIIPIIAIFIYYKLMPSFERNLQKLVEGTVNRKNRTFKLENFLARLTCYSREERIFFRFSYQMLKQEREFKLKIYPSLGIALVFPFIFIFNYLREASFAELADSKLYFTIYFCSMMLSIVIHMLKFSGNYKGAWIYMATPIERPGTIYSAALKVFLVKLYTPVFLLVAIVYLVLFPVEILPDLAVIFVSACLQTLITFKLINNETYPFSKSFFSAQSANTFLHFLVMFLVGLFAGVHALMLLIPYGIYIYLLTLLLVTGISWCIILLKPKPGVNLKKELTNH